MRTIQDCVHLLRNTADMLADRAVRASERGLEKDAEESSTLATAYRTAAAYLERQIIEDAKHA
jgi:hypothetical protein